jgi:hypothetical protein
VFEAWVQEKEPPPKWLELLSGSFKLIYKDKDEAAN